MSTTNPAYAACPVGMAVFFPWLTEPPNSDWIICDGKSRLKGDYPQMDALRESQSTNCRVDSQVYATSTMFGENDDLSIEASASAANSFIGNVFLPHEYSELTAVWFANVEPGPDPHWITVNFKNGVRRLLTGIELVSQGQGFPQTFRFWGEADGESWPLTAEITLSEIPAAGEALYLPFEDMETRCATLKMIINESFPVYRGTTIARMRLFAKEDRTFIPPLLGENLSNQKGIWCLRVSDGSAAG